MALRESEAIVLRTYPLREADLLVTFFTRIEGKVHVRANRLALLRTLLKEFSTIADFSEIVTEAKG